MTGEVLTVGREVALQCGLDRIVVACIDDGVAEGDDCWNHCCGGLVDDTDRLWWEEE